MSAPACSRETLSRSQRLRSSGDFLRLKEQGRRQVLGCLILNYRPSAVQVCPRLGVVTSKRIGNAVVRNRARRLLREVFRRRRHLMLPTSEVVLVARPSIAGLGYDQVERDFMDALRRARLLASVKAVSSEVGTP